MSIQEDHIKVGNKLFTYYYVIVFKRLYLHDFLQDYGIKHVILSKGQYKILKMVSSNFLIMLLEQRRRNIALLLLA